MWLIVITALVNGGAPGHSNLSSYGGEKGLDVQRVGAISRRELGRNPLILTSMTWSSQAVYSTPQLALLMFNEYRARLPCPLACLSLTIP